MIGQHIYIGFLIGAILSLNIVAFVYIFPILDMIDRQNKTLAVVLGFCILLIFDCSSFGYVQALVGALP